MSLRSLTLLAVLIWLCSCEVSEIDFEPEMDIPEVDVPSPATSNGNLAAEYQTLLDLVNELRATGCRCGNQNMPPVGAVSWNDRIAIAALRHSRDMSNNEHFSHTGTDGSDAGVRITGTGYVWRTYGENIAVGYRSATAVFNGWKNSPGHCRNLMNANFREMGAAEVNDYWTQDFAAQR